MLTVHQAVFLLVDGRLPSDQGRYYVDVPRYYWDLGSVGGAFDALLRSVADDTGWYELAIAGWLRVVGRSPAAFELVGAAVYGGLLAGVGSVSLRLAGARVAVGTVALTAALPAVTLMARKDWIHVPEAALAWGALAVWLADPRLTRRRSVAGLAVLGAGAVLLRQSGLLWTGSLALLLGWQVFRHRVERKPAMVVLGAWSLAVVPLLPGISTYILHKLDARERYSVDVPPLAVQLDGLFGPVPLLLIVLGLLAGLPVLGRRWRPASLLLAVWAILPLPLYFLFRAGIDNFTPFAPAVALAAVAGACWLERRAVWVALGAVALYMLPQWGPVVTDTGAGALLPGEAKVESLRIRYRPTDLWGGGRVAALLDASCPDDAWRSCHVVVDQGLFMPTAEEFGLLELFLMGEDRVELRTVYEEPAEGWGAYGVNALVSFECLNSDDRWRRRVPDVTAKTVEVVDATDLQAAWWDRVQPDCSLHWLTPNGWFVDVQRMPAATEPIMVTPWTRAGALAAHSAFMSQNPEQAERTGNLTVVDEEQYDFPSAPTNWTRGDALAAQARVGRLFGVDRRLGPLE